MSLLDDVSIVVTPNGYKAGRLYGVLPTATEGSELVQDSNFSLTGTQAQSTNGTYWDTGAGWTIANNKATSNGTVDNLDGITLVTDKNYKATVTVSGMTTGNLSYRLGGSSSNEILSISSNGEYTAYGVAGGTVLRLRSQNGFNGSVTNISVKEWTASDMDVTRATAATRVDENGLVNYAEVLGSEEVTNGSFNTTIPIGNNGSGWAKVIAGSCTVEYDNGGVKLTQASVGNQDCKIYARTVGGSDNLLTVGKQYKVTYEVLSNNNSTVLKYYRGGTYLQIDHTVGTHTFYYEQESNQLSIFWNLTANSDITLDNISIKESDRNNVPRIDYTGGGCPHILAEPQSTNLVTYSEDISNSYWTKLGSSPSSGFTSPSGTSGAFKLVEDTSNGLHWMYSGSITVTNTTTYNLSVFAKKGERNYIRIAERSGIAVIVNLEDKVFDTIGSGVINSNITALVDDWVRIEYSFQTTSIQEEVYIYAADNGNINYQGNGSSGIYVWGVQLEQLSYPTSYIPTSGSAITRNQDQFTRDGIASLINDSEGVLFLEVARLSSADNTSIIWSISDGSNSNAVSLYYASTGVKVDIFNSTGTKTLQHSMSLTEQANFNKLAIKYKSNDIALWVNGNEVATNTDAISLSGLNELISSYGSGSFNFFGKIKQLQVYDTALTDTQLAALTS